jgi:hypothetical protein
MPILHVVIMLAVLALLAILVAKLLWWAVLAIFATCLLIILVLYRSAVR